ncbi:protease SohB [Alcanivorax limicola]|uniref:protease SohB n=1 Tax=Alcanivorax limicola TaxID=2874102 RepID=UPI001CC10F03|nr:protease SohB [Alcanivorax limicola]
MIELLTEYGLFLAKVATLVFAILFVIGGIVDAAARQRGAQNSDAGDIRVRHLNEELDDLRDSVRDAVLPEAERKAARKRERKEEKARQKAAKKAGAMAADHKPRVFVLDFDGDVQASAVESLRREISAVLETADKKDEIVVRLESPGGLVHAYGLASSQLKRVRNQGIRLTVCVDKVAASGGYMMACIADRIVAAPFAIVGSVGVVAQIPNFHRLLEKNDIDVELMTAGEYKRTLTMFGENTDQDREKFQEELEDTHVLFKDFVREHRRNLDIDKIATGEHWFGIRAKDIGLVDELQTSDEYLLARCKDAEVYEVSWNIRQKLAERLGLAFETGLGRVVEHWFHRGARRWW